MITVEELIEKLQGDLSRRAYSFAEYITISSPYVPEGKQPMLEHVERLAAQEQDSARLLGRLILSLGGVPNAGLFDESVADMNYLSIDYLMKLLLEWKRESLRRLEERVEDSSGYPEAREALLAIAEQERRQCQELQSWLGDADNCQIQQNLDT